MKLSDLDKEHFKLLLRLPAGIRNHERELAFDLVTVGLAEWVRAASNYLDATEAGRAALSERQP